MLITSHQRSRSIGHRARRSESVTASHGRHHAAHLSASILFFSLRCSMTMPLLFSTLPGIMWKGKRNPALGVLVILLCSSFLLVTGFSETTMATNAWQWYKLSLRNRPLLTKSATSAVVMTISDILTQKMERFMMKHDPQESSAKLTKRHAAGSTSMAIQPHSPPRSPSSMLSSLNDWRRTGDVAITGFVWSGPVSHTWYAILERVVTVNHRILGIVIRLALDATIFSPCVGTYHTGHSKLRGIGRTNNQCVCPRLFF